MLDMQAYLDIAAEVPQSWRRGSFNRTHTNQCKERFRLFWRWNNWLPWMGRSRKHVA